MFKKVAGALLLTLLAMPGATSAAEPGDSFLTTYLEMPAGAIPGGQSGYADDEGHPSPSSSDGRYVAFVSSANRMAPGADPDSTNIFRKDRATGDVVLVSRASGADTPGPAANFSDPRISSDGNLVAFITKAALDPADTDFGLDVYTRDVSTNTTTLATPDTIQATEQFDLSGNGAFVAFTTTDALVAGDLNGGGDVYRRNLGSGAVELASRITASATASNGSSFDPAISDDGDFVAFSSTASDLTAGFVDNNGPGSGDIYVRHISANVNALVSNRFNSAVNGGNGRNDEPVIAGAPANLNAVRIAFDSEATNLTDNMVADTVSTASVYLKSFPVVPSTLVTRNSSGVNADSRAHTPSISDDATLVGFSSDAGNLGAGASYYGSYLRDLDAGTTTLVSLKNEYAINPTLSGSGNLVTWIEAGSAETNTDPELSGIFGRGVPGGPIELVSRPPGNAPFLTPAAETQGTDSGGRHTLSADGRFQTFSAYSLRLPGATPPNQSLRVFRRDLKTGEIILISQPSGNGGVASDYASDPSMSADGNRIAFASLSSLDPAADTDTESDIYVRDVSAATTTLVSRATGAGGADANTGSGDPSISADGSRVAFMTDSSNLEGGGANFQVYVRDLNSNETILVSKNGAVAGNGASEHPALSRDGSRAVFQSRATDLHPDDPDLQTDIYVKDLASPAPLLVSRRPGLAGAKPASSTQRPAISNDGNIVTFESTDQDAAPEAGPWPPGPRQVVARNVATGANTLVSRAPGGPPSAQGASGSSISGDGSVVVFQTTSENLVPGRGGSVHPAVFAKNLNTGAISAPTAFGRNDNYPQQGTRDASISENGQCMGFIGIGSNPASGDSSDIRATYVYVVSGSCEDPRNQPPPPPPPTTTDLKPTLSKVSLKPKRFAVGKKPTAKVAAKQKRKKTPKGTRVRFMIDVKATVAIVIQKRAVGRKVGGKCRKTKKSNRGKKKCARFFKVGKLQRKNLSAGARKVAFSGRIGKKKLKAGKYRAAVRASNQVGSSKTINRPFVIVRR